MSDSYEDALREHVAGFFRGHAVTAHTWESRQVARLNPAFFVMEMGPGERTSAWTYLTAGAGRGPPDGGRRLEFVLCAPEPSQRHVQLLYMTAHYHLTGEALGVGHMFAIGQPWVPGSSLDCMLVSLPYPFGPALEVFDRGEHHARLLWLMPVTSAERAFARTNGAEALEALFDANGVDYLDPARPSVVGEN